MENGLIGRYDVSGRLVAVSALSVSSGMDGPAADISCQRDGLGRLVIPGTALAGCLRRIVADPLWGSEPGADDDDAAVSRITTHDAPFVGDTENLEVRDGVAIDRVTGAAAEHMLYGREVVAAGAEFALSLSVDVTAANGQQEAVLHLVTRLVRALEASLAVGGSTTRGLGSVQLLDAEVTWTPLASAASFLEYLRSGPKPVPLPDVELPGRNVLTVTIPWKPRAPILVSVPVGGGVDAIPRHTSRDGGVHLVLPGSSVKGVLRSHAERIVRTLVVGSEVPEAPLEQFREYVPLVSELFGRAPDSSGEGAWRGAASCADVLSRQAVTGWDDLMAALKPRTDTARAEGASRLERSRWLRVDDHVAISRWTGGADDGKLFAWVAPWPGKAAAEGWEPMRLSVDLTRLGAHADAAVMLLAHVLRDLCGGWLAFGHGTTRGYGEVTAALSDVTFVWGQSGESWMLSKLFADETSPLVQAWQAQTDEWISASSEGVRS